MLGEQNETARHEQAVNAMVLEMLWAAAPGGYQTHQRCGDDSSGEWAVQLVLNDAWEDPSGASVGRSGSRHVLASTGFASRIPEP